MPVCVTSREKNQNKLASSRFLTMTLALVLWEMFPWPLVFPLFSCPLKHPFLFLHFLQTRGAEALERFLSSPALSSHSHGTSYRSRGLTQHAVTQ